MNKIDKVIMNTIGKNDDGHNPYNDKSDWSIFDYFCGYGLPFLMFCGVIAIIVEACK